MLGVKYLVAAALLAAAAACDVQEDTCGALAPWEAAVEAWATAEHGNLTRQGRVMTLGPSHGYYVTDRVDLVPPPPPRPRPPHAPPPPHAPQPPHAMSHRGPYPVPHGKPSGPPPAGANYRPPQSGPPANYNHVAPGPGQTDSYLPSQGGSSQDSSGANYNSLGSNSPNYNPSGSNSPNYNPSGSNSPNHNLSGPSGAPSASEAPAGSMPYDEWSATPPPPPHGAGKIVNRPPNPYKDQFKPSYPPASPPIPLGVDRVDSPAPAPQKAVSETDLYLLRAIEKLVYRVDLLEKRMRKMEESMHYVVVGSEPKPEPCESNFTRVGRQCYFFSGDAVNWKSASYACRKLKGNLLELVGEERQQFLAGLQANKRYNGMDLWTGGLNPGLLWIWSHSATAVLANSTESSTSVPGDGRCLALVAAPGGGYVYQGQDCGLRHRYVCEKEEDRAALANEVTRVARAHAHAHEHTHKHAGRSSKMADWDATKHKL